MVQSTDFTIRPLTSAEDFLACVALQREAWGDALTDITPPTVLKIVQRVGGVSAGAFAPDGTMLGFVFGITGVERGRIVHWSHMLAVRAQSQNLGIGRQLKQYQRAQVAKTGAHVMYWTFDPLVARNAHLNINVMGALPAEYTRDAYPTMDRGAGTDRLIVAWPIDDQALGAQKERTAAAASDAECLAAPVVNPDPASPMVAARPPKLRVQIPSDISSIIATDSPLAARWRASTRAAFEALFASGYSVAGFVANTGEGRSYYLLAR